MTSLPTLKYCGPASALKPRAAALSLPVVQGHMGSGSIRKSKMGKWRAMVLIALHVAIAAHIVQWLYSGMQTGERRTVSPVEPSESMYTLELGELNAGFFFFIAALASTLVMGRWFCGWGCHVVALQDCCGWLMKKCGIHPKPWRSRLMLWVPLGMAVYMFVWPSFRRSVLEPLLTKWLGEVPVWIGQTAPLHGFTRAFIVEDFWKTFAPWHVAIPFLFVVGFAIVYFLGSKGFCTYGCPYGGFFAPLDKLSPMRIRVTDDCNQCGHCTAVCTSNVRVAEEVRDFGMVVDPGCFKCMDCTSVCPNDALYVGMGRPAVMAKPRTSKQERAKHAAARRARYDLALGEELAALVVFLILFRGFRGMPLMGEAVPLLMAVGMAAIGAFMAHKVWRMLRDLNVRGPRAQLKFGGRVTPLGWLFAVVTVAFALLGLQGAALWFVTTAGDSASAKIDRLRTDDAGPSRPLVTYANVYSLGYTPRPEVKALAEQGIAWLRLARPVWEGGVGFYKPWEAATRLAWLQAVAGDLAAAEADVRDALKAHVNDDLVLGLAQIIRLRASSGGVLASDPVTLDAVEAVYRDGLAREPGLRSTRLELAQLLGARGKIAEVGALYDEAITRDPGEVWLVRDAATVHMNLQPPQPEQAIAALRRGLAARPKSAAIMSDLASILLLTGKSSEGGRLVDQALALKPTQPEVVGRLAQCLIALDRTSEAVALAERSLEEHPRQPGAIRNAAGLNAQVGKLDRALQIMRDGVKAVPRDHYLGVELAGLLLQMGRRDEAAEQLRKVIAAQPLDAVTWRDIGQVAADAGMTTEAEAARRLQKALESPAPAGLRPVE